MSLRKGREPKVELEALALMAQFDELTPGRDTSIHDVQRRAALIHHLTSGLDTSLANRARLNGWRVQNLFEATLVCLGSIRIIATEDVGSYYFDDEDGVMKPPDFRLVRRDGERILVEVKNVAPKECRRLKVLVRDLDSQLRYAELTGARLKLAHYWSAMNLWTVVDPVVLARDGKGRPVLTINAAMKANEMGLLGDASIGTVPPLSLRVIADEAKVQTSIPVRPDVEERRFNVGAVELRAGDVMLTSSNEKTIAWFLMRYGRWDASESVELDNTGNIRWIEFAFSPQLPDVEAERRVAEQGFAIVGSLSSMYSALYATATMTDSGLVEHLRHEPDPGVLASLIPDDYWEDSSRALPIWKVVQEPNFDL